jgi:hypothetical protein
MKPIPAWLVALLLAACAAPGAQWEKPGASQSAVDEDSQQCRVQSRLDPEPQVGTLSPYSMGTPPLERAEQRDARESRRFTKCMQEKGYSPRR